VALGILLGVLATAIYDLSKAWLTPLMLEGRALEYREAMSTLIPVIAAGFSILLLSLFFSKWGFLGHKD